MCTCIGKQSEADTYGTSVPRGLFQETQVRRLVRRTAPVSLYGRSRQRANTKTPPTGKDYGTASLWNQARSPRMPAAISTHEDFIRPRDGSRHPDTAPGTELYHNHLDSEKAVCSTIRVYDFGLCADLGQLFVRLLHKKIATIWL